jgi:hypothetical protein
MRLAAPIHEIRLYWILEFETPVPRLQGDVDFLLGMTDRNNAKYVHAYRIYLQAALENDIDMS